MGLNFIDFLLHFFIQGKSGIQTVGLDFKAPKKNKVKEWEIIQSLYRLGNTFHTCGCNGPGYIPQNRKDYLTYLQKIRHGYQEKLEARNEEMNRDELADYVDFWTAKLHLINQQIAKVKA